MKPGNATEVQDLLTAGAMASALGAALELGLFQTLATGWRDPGDLGRDLEVSELRVRYWLQMLERTGLVESESNRYRISATGRRAILDSHPADSWSFFARSEREMQRLFLDLPDRLRQPAATWRGECDLPLDYVARMQADPIWAEAFTRMLQNLHENLAGRLADCLSGDKAGRFMDLGGGSGVMSHALLKEWPAARAVLVDIEPVTELALRMAEEAGLAERLEVHPVGDFTQDPLPGGAFDMILECDLSVHGPALFVKLASCLRPGGQLVILDQFAPAPGIAPPERLHWRFQGALLDRAYETPTVVELKAWLAEAGFMLLSEGEIVENWTLLVAEKPDR